MDKKFFIQMGAIMVVAVLAGLVKDVLTSKVPAIAKITGN